MWPFLGPTTSLPSICTCWTRGPRRLSQRTLGFRASWCLPWKIKSCRCGCTVKSTSRLGVHPGYPLVNLQKTMEYGLFIDGLTWFTYLKWWFSIAMLNYQRVFWHFTDQWLFIGFHSELIHVGNSIIKLPFGMGLFHEATIWLLDSTPPPFGSMIFPALSHHLVRRPFLALGSRWTSRKVPVSEKLLVELQVGHMDMDMFRQDTAKAIQQWCVPSSTERLIWVWPSSKKETVARGVVGFINVLGAELDEMGGFCVPKLASDETTQSQTWLCTKLQPAFRSLLHGSHWVSKKINLWIPTISCGGLLFYLFAGTRLEFTNSLDTPCQMCHKVTRWLPRGW